MVTMLHSKSSSTCLGHSSKHTRFKLSSQFQGIESGDTLKKKSLSKAILDGLKTVKSEHGIGDKTFPIHYFLEQDPI